MYLSILLLTLFATIISAILSITIYYEVGLCNSPVSINVISWVDSGILNVSLCFLFDSHTVSILIPVLIVSTLVHIYSIDYISSDPTNQRLSHIFHYWHFASTCYWW